jgi:hypothetical protein
MLTNLEGNVVFLYKTQCINAVPQASSGSGHVLCGYFICEFTKARGRYQRHLERVSSYILHFIVQVGGYIYIQVIQKKNNLDFISASGLRTSILSPRNSKMTTYWRSLASSASLSLMISYTWTTISMTKSLR